MARETANQSFSKSFLADYRGGGAAGGISRNGHKFTSEHLQYPDDLGSADKGHMVLFFINVPEASKILKGSSGKSAYATSGDARYSSNVTNAALQQTDIVIGTGAGAGMGAASAGKGAAAMVRARGMKANSAAGAMVATASAIGLVGGAVVGAAAGLAANALLGMKKGYKQLNTSIALYMPQEFSTGHSAGYSSVDTSALANLISEGGGKYDLKNLGETSSSVGQRMLKNMASAAEDVAVGRGMAQKLRGKVENPNAEQIFERISHREFQFTFNLAAKTASEAVNIRNIINTFKYHMHPELTEQNYLILPSEFEIAFYSDGEENMFLGKISTCALTSLATNFTPNGVWTSLDGGFVGWPPVVTITLRFQEMDLLTKDRLEAWGEYQQNVGLDTVDGFAGPFKKPNNPQNAVNNSDNPQGRH